MKKRFLILTMLLVSIFSFQSVSADSVVNLLPPNMDSPIIINGVTITHVNNIYTLNGTSTSSTSISLLDSNISGTGTTLYTGSTIYLDGVYTLSMVEISGTASSSPSVFLRNTNLNQSVSSLTELIKTETWLDDNAYFYYYFNSDTTFDNYVISIQLEEGTVAHAYVDYIVPNANLSFITGFIAILSAWVTGFWGVVSSSINGAVIVFYDGTNLTTLGVLALFGLASGLVMFGLAFVKNLIKK